MLDSPASFSSLIHARHTLHKLFVAVLLSPLPALACTGSVHIELENTELYALDHAAIVAAQPGLADCTSDRLVMKTKGKEVALRVVDEDGKFGPGDRVEWLGQQLHGPASWFNNYSINNVYVLSAADGSHMRMHDLEAAGAGAAPLERTLHMEQENLLIRLDPSQHKPGEEPDVWQWVKLTHADPEPFSTRFDLPDLASTRTADVRLRLNFRGISKVAVPYKLRGTPVDDHVLDVRVNGALLEQLRWNGRDEFTHEISVAAENLRPAANKLTLSIPKRGLPWKEEQNIVDVVMFNWMEASYPLKGDIEAGAPPMQTAQPSDLAIELHWKGDGPAPALVGDDGSRRLPLKLGNGRYRYASAPPEVSLYPEASFASPVALRSIGESVLRTPGTGYDYLIVSHASLIDSIRPLAEYHEKQGLKVAVLDVASVYDEFNHGIVHPQAIRNLVDHAWHEWPEPRPRFLLLVGDASFDIRHDEYNDLAYAKFAHSAQEMLPGQFSGIPATRYESTDKLLASRNLIPTWQYPSAEGQSASDNWFGAVDGDDYHPVVAVGRFPVVEPAEVSAIVDKTLDYLTTPQPGSWRRDVMFITDESNYFKKASDEIASSVGQKGFLSDKIYASSDEKDNIAHQSAIKDGLNSGQLLVHFIGHGGRYIWRTGPPDLRKNHDLFTLDDVSQLENGDRLPMILSMTCYSAPFDNPTEDSIGERFLREPGKGAVAVFAASWRNAPSTTFSKNLVKELLVPDATIGEAIVRAKKSIDDRTLVEMYNLLGDPAVVLERPRSRARVQLAGGRWDPSVTVALPDKDFYGRVGVDWIDAENKILATMDYQVESNVFSLPVPRFEGGKIARAVGVYASDKNGDLDELTGFRLDFARYHRRNGFQLSAWLNPEKPRAADTIMFSGYDEEPDYEAEAESASED
ncbi:C25 family cysteine peptidase [Dokdonella sp.]|uniref:C25 family cysteine peptidase n=1 Tax=Dokdonella sp. TaxID=2291710 RepID=UPI0035270661